MLLEYSVENPLNREPPIGDLVKSFITKASTAYDRNHGPLPHINGDDFLVHIDGAVKAHTDLSIATLRNDFPQHEVIATLQCAGNRRHTMRTAVKEVDGIDWNDGAVCNCTWSGPLLADVLAHIGVTLSPEEEEAHVTFNCFQTDVQDDVFYGGSIPLSRCLDPSKKVLLALDMNGCPLTINHGFPLRVVAPGIAGARWTKWLDRITIQHDESENYYQQRDYKILPPYVTTPEQALEAWPLVPAIQGMPINSIIACPEPDSAPAVSKRGELRICGYALPQEDDGPVVGVEVSCDLGKSWAPAEIVFPRKTELGEEKYKWAWAIWEYWMPADLVGGITPETKIWSRARDKGGNMQDGSVPWNYRGVAYNAYGETKGLRVQGVEKAERRVTGV